MFFRKSIPAYFFEGAGLLSLNLQFVAIRLTLNT